MRRSASERSKVMTKKARTIAVMSSLFCPISPGTVFTRGVSCLVGKAETSGSIHPENDFEGVATAGKSQSVLLLAVWPIARGKENSASSNARWSGTNEGDCELPQADFMKCNLRQNKGRAPKPSHE